MGDDYLEASVRVSSRHAELVEDLLLGQGAYAVTLTDSSDTPILEPGVGETPLWDEVTLTGLFPGHADGGLLAATLSLAPGVDAPEQVEVSGVEDRDWVRVWMDRFEPMQFGESLWIVPTGKTCPDPDATQVHLDPGLAFGTGTHPTTRLCLEWIDGQELNGLTVLDFGCGSGVLGIAAALKGAGRVICIDNDPQAILATCENARRNGVQDVVEASEGGEAGDCRAEVVVSNILAGILVGLADELQAAVSPGGKLALTGILAGQAEQVSAAYRENFPALEKISGGDWVLLSGTKKPS